MRSPTSASENRVYGAEKIGPSRYFDFFNKSTQTGRSDWGDGTAYDAICPYLLGHPAPPYDSLALTAGKIRMDQADGRNRK